MKILIVEDDPLLRTSLAEYVKDLFDEVHLSNSLHEAKNKLIVHMPDIILLDNRLPDGDGIYAIHIFKEIHPLSEIIIMTAYGNSKTIVEAIKNGAFHYIPKPFEVDELINLLKKAIEKVKDRFEKLQHERVNIELIGKSSAIQNIKQIINSVKDFEVPVLIVGETGTGKEIVAKRIHYTSIRKHKRFIAVNCSAIPSELFESEMFGHEKGAFTGAEKKKTGLLEEVSDGTLLLDEIGDMPLHMQTKLLRVLEEKKFRRLGGNTILPFRGRILAATNKNLIKEIEKGNFREDLLFRLNVITIEIPPLRERKEDIPPLAEHFVSFYARKYRKGHLTIDKHFIDELMGYDWPGNVRELKNVIERAVILTKGPQLEPQFLNLGKEKSKTGKISVMMSLSEIEKLHIKNVLEYTGWNKSKAARILGISRVTLRKKIQHYKISPEKN